MDYDSPSKMKFVMKVDNRKGISSSIIEDWTTIRNLVIVRDKVQNIIVRCRRAIVVLMHSHVTLVDALACVQASHGIVGVFACSCCQWEPHQNHLPNDAEGGGKEDFKYSDSCLLSDKNEIRLWIRPKGVYPLPHTQPATQPAESVLDPDAETTSSTPSALAAVSDCHAAVSGGDSITSASGDGAHLILNHKHRSSHWKAAKKAKKKAAAAATAAAAAGDTETAAVQSPSPELSQASLSRFQFGLSKAKRTPPPPLPLLPLLLKLLDATQQLNESDSGCVWELNGHLLPPMSPSAAVARHCTPVPSGEGELWAGAACVLGVVARVRHMKRYLTFFDIEDVDELSEDMLKPRPDSAAAAAAAAVLHEVLITASHRHATTGM